MRLIVACLVMILLGLQYKLWVDNDSLLAWLHLNKKLQVQLKQNQALLLRNQAIAADIAELKSGEQALEERARFELGMVKQDEIYYQLVD